MFMGVLSARLCITCVPCAYKNQKRALHSLNSLQMDAGDQTQVLRKNSKCSNPWRHLSIIHVLM